jgi:hypothetical protein
MQHVALSFVFDDYRKHGMQTFYVPLLLYIREHAATILRDRPSLGDLIETYFNNPTQTKHYLAPPAGWFEQQLRAGRCIVLLDGMDEVPTPEDRQAIAAWIDSQISTYNQALFVITSRPGGYKEAPLAHDRKSILSMQSFTQEQRREFLEKWYEAHYGRFIIVTPSGARKRDEARARAENKEKADRKAKEVLAELADKPVLNEFAGNPLLLTMIAIAAQTEGGLPDSRLELYEEIYDVLLYRRAKSRKIQETLTRSQKDQLLRTLAMFVMMRDTSLEVSTGEAMQTWRAHITRFQVPENSLPMLQSTTNLVIPVADERWIFAHKTFLEYIAAREIQERGVAAEWRDLVEKTWWHETLRFYAEMVGDATAIVDACLESQMMPALMLAAHFIDTRATVQIDAATRKQLEDLLLTALESNDAERFRLAADVQLARRCASLHRIDEQREIDLTYITCAEYQVFLDEKRAEGEHYQPDHWTGYRFAPGQAREPITGVRSDDARSFCEWLTARQSDDAQYRLPTLEEVEQYAPNEARDIHSICQDRHTGEVVFAAVESTDSYGIALDVVHALVPDELCHLIGIRKSERDHALFNELAHYSSRTKNSPRATISALAPDFALARDRDLDRALVRERDLDRALALERALNLTRGLALEHALNLDRALTRDLTRDLDRDRARDLDRDLIRDLDRDRARDRARDLAFPSDVSQAIDNQDYNQAQSLLNEIRAEETNHYARRRAALLLTLLEVLRATSGAAQRWAWRRYTALVLLYAWIGYEMAEKEKEPRQWWQRWRARRPKVDYTSEKEAVLVAYIWLAIVMWREQGDLPAWEGIRIVRERRDM